jgi:hypothetical protein
MNGEGFGGKMMGPPTKNLIVGISIVVAGYLFGTSIPGNALFAWMGGSSSGWLALAVPEGGSAVFINPALEIAYEFDTRRGTMLPEMWEMRFQQGSGP